MVQNIPDPPANIVRQILIDETVGIFPTGSSSDSWPIYVSVMPDQPTVPDNAIAIFDTTGIIQDRSTRNGQYAEQYGIQILIRASDYPTAYSKFKVVLDAIDEIKYQNKTFNSTTYKLFNLRRTSAFALGQEDDVRRRQEFSINALFSLTVS
jgi:hypothetical protein